MKVLVFGQSGQVARALHDATPPSFDVRFLGRAEADLTNPAACADAITAHRPEAVINAAAYANVDGAETETALTYRVNAEAPGGMAEAAAALGVPFVHISSDYVFTGSGTTPQKPDTPTAPLNTYGKTKLAGEIAVRQSGARHVILRTSWLFSPYGQNFVKTMLRLAETRQELDVVADQIGGPTPARALATALFAISRALVDGAKAGTYHFAGAPNVGWSDFARAIFATAKLDVTVRDIPTSQYRTPAQRPLNSRLDCATLTADFGIKQPQWKSELTKVIRELGA